MLTLRRRRRPAVIALLVLALTATASYGIAPAHAADPIIVNVIGTSDVSDSNLMQSVIKPGFEAANPGYRLNYTGKATGAAITGAEQGGYDALIVHAASLENQFVDDGYSQEGYGRAIFWGDFVLAGPAADPAGVGSSAAHDVVRAYEKIAAAGAAGTATFVSRGATPGTTVAEHAIWQLVHDDANPAATLPALCQVGPSDGGGYTPYDDSDPANCPNNDPKGTGARIANVVPPSWYKVTGQTQGPNVTTADQCNPDTFHNGGCYVFTDRGTFQYLKSTAAITKLQVVTRDNSESAPGGITALVNSFHGYVLNAATLASKASYTVNVAGATAVMAWITSPAGQSAIGAYLAKQGGAAFLPSATPKLTAVPSAGTSGGQTVSGTLTNVVPGTPALSGVSISLLATNSANVTSVVSSTTTDSAGAYSIDFTPAANTSYVVATPPSLEQVEDPDLSPVFGDVLQGTTVPVGYKVTFATAGGSSIGPVSVTPGSTVAKPTNPTRTGYSFAGWTSGGAAYDFSTPVTADLTLTAHWTRHTSTVKLTKVTVRKHRITIRGTLSPAAPKGSYLTFLKGKRKPAASGLSMVGVRAGARTFTISTTLPVGKWKVQVRYDPGGDDYPVANSAIRSVTVKR